MSSLAHTALWCRGPLELREDPENYPDPHHTPYQEPERRRPGRPQLRAEHNARRIEALISLLERAGPMRKYRAAEGIGITPSQLESLLKNASDADRLIWEDAGEIGVLITEEGL